MATTVLRYLKHLGTILSNKWFIFGPAILYCTHNVTASDWKLMQQEVTAKKNKSPPAELLSHIKKIYHHIRTADPGFEDIIAGLDVLIGAKRYGEDYQKSTRRDRSKEVYIITRSRTKWHENTALSTAVNWFDDEYFSSSNQ